jgi:PPOX class probable F420-dependent enzyme
MDVSTAVRRFLSQPHFATVATINPDGLPHQTVVWYELQGDAIMMNTRRGRVKDRNLRRDPRLSICVENGYQAVTITGTAELIEDQTVAQADIFRLAERYDGHDAAVRSAQRFSREQRVTVRVPIEQVTPYGLDED